ncbi:hypothetical protein D3C81_182880 [compost metagenome]
MRLYTDNEKNVVRKTTARLDELIEIYESQHVMTQEEYNDTQKEILSIRTLKQELEDLLIVVIETIEDCDAAYKLFVSELNEDGYDTNVLEFTLVAYESDDYKIEIETIREFLTVNRIETNEIEDQIKYLLNSK